MCWFVTALYCHIEYVWTKTVIIIGHIYFYILNEIINIELTLTDFLMYMYLPSFLFTWINHSYILVLHCVVDITLDRTNYTEKICFEKPNTNIQWISLDALSFWPSWPSFVIVCGHSLGSSGHYLWLFHQSKILKFLWPCQPLLTQTQSYYIIVQSLNRRPLLHSPLKSSLWRYSSTKMPILCALWHVHYQWATNKVDRNEEILKWSRRRCNAPSLHKMQKS